MPSRVRHRQPQPQSLTTLIAPPTWKKDILCAGGHYGCLAQFIGDAVGEGRPASYFVEDLRQMWARAGTELESNKAADCLVCKMDLGVLPTFHELLGQLPIELVQLAAEITSAE